MVKRNRKDNWIDLLSSKRAIALPITFLMLFVSLTFLISATYYFSITRISAKTSELKVSGAEQEMLNLDKLVSFVSWAPGSYQIYDFSDFGGKFKLIPDAKRLLLNLTDNVSFYDVLFDDFVGKALYELPSSDMYDSVFLKGDARVVVNKSSSTMTQLVASQGGGYSELTLSYRPFSGSTHTGSSNGKPTNELRVYIVKLSSSQTITRLGSFRLKVTCMNVASSWKSYNFTYPLPSLSLKAFLDSDSGEVSMPISSNSQGAIVSLETITCSVKMEDVGW